MKPKCEGKGRFGWDCDRKGTIEREGKWYCWQHDPDRLDREARERNEQRKRELAELEAKHEARLARRILEETAGTNNLTDDDLRRIIELGGIRKLLQQEQRP